MRIIHPQPGNGLEREKKGGDISGSEGNRLVPAPELPAFVAEATSAE
jgi:hypothetical protein